MRSVLFSPHCDDETLFASFLLQKYRPTVAICFGSTGDYGETEDRLAESSGALTELLKQFHLCSPSVKESLRRFVERVLDEWEPEVIWIPSRECSHPDHRMVHDVVKSVSGTRRLLMYDTYLLDSRGHAERVRTLPPSLPDSPEWVIRKLRALAEYKSQICHPRAQQFFMDPLYEYAEQP